MRESELQNEVVRLAIQAGWRVYHSRDSKRFPHGKGFPDLVLGRVSREPLVIELKSATGKVGDLQHLWLSFFEKAGIPTYVFRPNDLPTIRRILMDGSASPISVYISPSQLEQFHCRLAWWWGTRKKLQSVRLQKHLELGTGVHLGLQRYYAENKNPVKVFTRWADKRLDELDPQWDEDIQEMIQLRTLGIAMLEGYLKEYRRKEPLKAVLVEGEMKRRVPNPLGEPSSIAVVTRVDTVVRDTSLNKLFILEHKTFTRWEPSQLERDHQFVAELWVAQQHFKERIAGVIYNGLRKQIPSNRVKNPLFERRYLYINENQIKVFLQRCYSVGLQLLAGYKGHLGIYPEPSLFRCQQCPFKDPCTAFMRGDDYQYILDNLYEKKPPYEERNRENS